MVNRVATGLRTEYSGYLRLAAEIIRQSVDDWHVSRSALRCPKCDRVYPPGGPTDSPLPRCPEDGAVLRRHRDYYLRPEIESFLGGKWFGFLCGALDLDAELIARAIRSGKHGSPRAMRFVKAREEESTGGN